jgi:nitroreductase
MELYEAMRTTPATRDFAEEPVPDEVLHRILENARFAPSGGNRQGWSVVIVRDEIARHRLRDLYVLGWREYTAHIRAGRVPFAPGPGGRWDGPAVDLEEARATFSPFPFADHLDEAPVLLLLCAQLDVLACTDNGLDRQSIVGGASVYPFAHNVLLAARNEGLGGVITTVLCRQEPAVKELFGIPDGVAVAGLIALGRPRQAMKRLSRRPVEEFVWIDRFGGPPFTSR